MIAFLNLLIFRLFFNQCRTFTTSVPVSKCLQSIKDYAFHKSDYPVILTLEDHLTPKHHDKFAKVSSHCQSPPLNKKRKRRVQVKLTCMPFFFNCLFTIVFFFLYSCRWFSSIWHRFTDNSRLSTFLWWFG